MSATTIDTRERLIVALDVPAPEAARALAERIGDAACFYKVGLELLASGGSFELVQSLAARGHRIFADFKFFDIPETVRRAVANLRGRGVTFATVHGSRPIMEAAIDLTHRIKRDFFAVLGPHAGDRLGPGQNLVDLRFEPEFDPELGRKFDQRLGHGTRAADRIPNSFVRLHARDPAKDRRRSGGR